MLAAIYSQGVKIKVSPAGTGFVTSSDREVIL
jgi:hypothetical protein